ncbi:MAG: alpha/beta hydrolase [Chitinophagales bacterium]
MKKVYFISGLGADKRVFSFLDLSFCEPIYIDWIDPLKKESLESYALRLRNSILQTDPVIVGISFGGMLATEMAKADPKVKAIIISSNKTADEFPTYLRIGKYLPIYKWMPGKVMKQSAYIIKWVFGRNGKEQKRVFLEIVRDTNPDFVKWAITSILNWKNREVPKNLIHLHGTADRLLPHRFVKADHLVKGGNHVMPMDSHEEVSALLRELIQ